MAQDPLFSWRLLTCYSRVNIRTVMFMAVVATLLCGSALFKKQNLSTRWSRFDLETCLPKSNVAFLKTHKCASTAIQNILFRYGDKHNLHFALPNSGNHFGGKNTFKAAMVRSSPLNTVTPNIFALHTKWDHAEVKKVMPEDTVFFTIVREPTAVFQSLFAYSRFQEKTGLALHEYVRKVPADFRISSVLGYNQMSWDFGMPLKDMNNLSALHEMVQRADEHFGLVLVAERMDESLVLLAEYLCWELSDVLVLKLNSLNDKFKSSISEETQQMLQKKLAPDYLLYNHFLERFNQQVRDFGLARMAAAVDRLQELMALLVSRCNFVRKDFLEFREGKKPCSKKVSVFESEASGSCDAYTRVEMAYINVLRKKQQRTIAEKLRQSSEEGGKWASKEEDSIIMKRRLIDEENK